MTPAAASAAPATTDVGVLVPAAVHFDDLDALGMLHNSRHQVMVERAWAAYWREQRQQRDQEPERQGEAGEAGAEDDGHHVVKAFTITYEAPVTQPGTYAVHLWVQHMGTTSATVGFRVCSADGRVTYAHGSRTLVRLDRATRRPAPWSDRARALARTIAVPRRGD